MSEGMPISTTPPAPTGSTRAPTSTRRTVLNTIKGSAGNLVTFLMRPVGSWFFGRFADRRGRKAALMFSVTVMSGCSFIVAVTPTREVIGWLRDHHRLHIGQRDREG